jgi:hypothetical protein
MMYSGLVVLLISAAAASRMESFQPAAPGPAPGPAPESMLDGVQGFVDLLPYSPDRMNYQMTKSKCIDFVNHMLDKCGHDATRLLKLMPKCLWSKEECQALEADFIGRIPSTAMPGGPAGAPAAALLAKKVTMKSPGGGDAVFGWCDTLYSMAKKRWFSKLKADRPAPGMDPLPEETGMVNRDVKMMNKWMENNVGGPPAPALSKTDKLLNKMKTVGNAMKTASGWDHFEPEREKAKEAAKAMSGHDHFEPERETAKKMAKGVSGHDHFSKKDDDKKDEKEDKE